MTDKEALRRPYLTKRRALNREHAAKWSRQIQRTIIDSSDFQNASVIALYDPIHNEVDTAAAKQAAWETKKIVGLPHWDPEKKTISFYRIDPASRLARTDWGTQEPVPDTATALQLQDIDLILVPGIAFDRRGYRLGYGQGGYDRILAHYSGEAWGLAFELQLIDSLPHEPHDIPCSRIITEQGAVEVL